MERELAKRKLGRGRFAISIDEFPQTISAIIDGKRDMNTALALKIEQKLGLEEGFLKAGMIRKRKRLTGFMERKQLKVY